jgi:hypothetical protein
MNYFNLNSGFFIKSFACAHNNLQIVLAAANGALKPTPASVQIGNCNLIK